MSVPILTLDCERHIAVAREPEPAPSHRATNDLVARVLAAFFAVYRELGYGFAPPLYVRALQSELQLGALSVQRNPSLVAYYRGQTIGNHSPDLLVEQSVVVLVRASPALGDGDRAHLLNLMRCARLQTGVLVNFGTRPDFAPLSYRVKSP